MFSQKSNCCCYSDEDTDVYACCHRVWMGVQILMQTSLVPTSCAKSQITECWDIIKESKVHIKLCVEV